VDQPETVGTEISQGLLKAARALAKMAKEEDLGTGDLTSTLLEQAGDARFELLLKQPAVFAGQAVAEEILRLYDDAIHLEWRTPTADPAPTPPGSIHFAWAIEPSTERRQEPPTPAAAEPAGQPVKLDGVRFDRVPVRLATLSGPNRAILAAERVLLNFLQRLSGVATLTHQYVAAVSGTNAKVYDTRKTTPGWRALEKYAVRCGGGHNHRMGLYDAVLVKDNHLAGIPVARLSHAVFEMLNRAAQLRPPPCFVEVEADRLEQVEALFKVVGIQVILLDNFGLDELRRAVERRDTLGLKGRVELEASGGITLDTIRAVAETGVERISVGAITHSATAVDLSLARL
jgi:nicotinate-nucleotide pyrophosphorylase (carboxylating)